MNGQDFGIFTRADHDGIYATGDVDGQERLVGSWYANSNVKVPLIGSLENVENGLVVHLAEKMGKIFIRFES